MAVVLLTIAFLFGPPFVTETWSDDVLGARPLRSTNRNDIRAVIPPDTRLLNDPRSIEEFLDELDGRPPDWATVYGHGHHDPGHDNRLFDLNRERDAQREGKPGLQQRVTFIWSGELSRYDARAGGFHVSLGPRFIVTRWGVVRFKYEDLPSNLLAIPTGSLRKTLRRKLDKKQKIEIDIAMTGRLIPAESLVYDFSHDQEGLGLIMPVVKVEQVDYFIAPTP
jgi:hypothetical protein